MKTLATIFFLFYCLVALGQAPLVKLWDKGFGGNDMDYFTTFCHANDRGYLLVGSTTSGGHIWGSGITDSTHGGLDFWVIKIDSIGNQQWDKRFGGSEADWLTAMQKTTDNGYILGGTTNSDSSEYITELTRDTSTEYWNEGDYWIVKIDSLGNKEWDKRFGGSLRDDLKCLQQTTDGGYILGGTSSSGMSGDKTQDSWDTIHFPLSYRSDYWIVKTDALGNKQWDRRFGGINLDFLNSIQQTIDGGYILGGYSGSGINGDKTQDCRDTISNLMYRQDYWIIKIDSLGNKLWDKRFGGIGQDILSTLMPTLDGGFILGGSSSSGSTGDRTQGSRGVQDYWVVKIDSLGSKEWDKRYGGPLHDELYNIFQTSDGGFIFSGDSYSNSGGWDKSEWNFNYNSEETWIVKTDALGNKQWDKTIFTNSSFLDDESGYAIQIEDGSYVIANFTGSGIGGYKTQPNWNTNGSCDYWIIKFQDTSSICYTHSTNITSNNNIICSNDTAQFCAPTIFSSYQWSNGANTDCITTNLAGNYYVTVTDANGCTAESNHVAISVYPLPPVSISVNGDTLSVYGAVTQQWYLNGGPISNATSITYIVTQGGSYTVMVTDSNGCTATSNPVIISAVDNVIDDAVNIYPNPTNTTWHLAVTNAMLGGTVEVSDNNGRIVFKSEITNQQSEINFDVAKGVYFMRVSAANGSVVKKLVKL